MVTCGHRGCGAAGPTLSAEGLAKGTALPPSPGTRCHQETAGVTCVTCEPALRAHVGLGAVVVCTVTSRPVTSSTDIPTVASAGHITRQKPNSAVLADAGTGSGLGLRRDTTTRNPRTALARGQVGGEETTLGAATRPPAHVPGSVLGDAALTCSPQRSHLSPTELPGPGAGLPCLSLKKRERNENASELEDACGAAGRQAIGNRAVLTPPAATESRVSVAESAIVSHLVQKMRGFLGSPPLSPKSQHVADFHVLAQFSVGYEA